MRSHLVIAIIALPAVQAIAGALAPMPQLALAPSVVTNKPVVVEFEPAATNQQFFTSSAGTNTVTLTNFVKTSAGYVINSNVTLTIKVWEEIPMPRITNSMITCVVWTNRDYSLTNFFRSVIANRGPVTFWLPPTNRYVFTLWGLASDGQKWPVKQVDWPAAPSNQVRFVVTPIFSRDLHNWTIGTNVYTFTVTNGIDYGSNSFVKWSATAVKDDFTPKALRLDANTFTLFPTNAQ